MQLIFQKPISSYLAQPDLTARRKRQWAGFQSRFLLVSRSSPRAAQRVILALIIWSMGVIGVRFITNPANTDAKQTVTDNVAVSQPSVLNDQPTLVQLAHVQMLPSGPTGLLLPPGSMAPDNTYANDYDWGQCTWYVAGRRKVPADWGNADTWYPRAQADDWSVGATPAIGAIAWTPDGPYGHVALVESISADESSVYVSEMNYVGLGIKSYRWVPASAFKYIY